MKFINTFSLIFALSLTTQAMAFPENTHLGYSSCQTCHISPTGGGLLSTYGRRLSEERLSTWAEEPVGDPLWGYAKTPTWLLLGGDIRYLDISIDNDLFKYDRDFIMQVEFEFAAQITDQLAAVTSFGRYDGSTESQQHYLLYQLNDHWLFRGGKFMPAFGINAVEHSVSTRKSLFLNQGQETYNLEAGFLDEWGEIFIDAVVGGSAEETGEKETGGTAKFAFYVFETSQIGASYLMLNGPGFQRTAYGPQIILGFPADLYLTSDYILQSRKLEAGHDIPEKTENGYFNFTKLGYEPIHGLHLLAQLDQRQSDKDNDLTFYQAYGPGFQWLPYPHFEISSSYYMTSFCVFISGLYMHFIGKSKALEETHAHLGLLFVAGACLHVYLNWKATKIHLKKKTTYLVLIPIVFLTILSILEAEKEGERKRHRHGTDESSESP